MNLEFSRQILEEYSNMEVVKIRLVRAQLLRTDERTDRHDKSNSRFSQFSESEWKLDRGIKAYITLKYRELVC